MLPHFMHCPLVVIDRARFRFLFFFPLIFNKNKNGIWQPSFVIYISYMLYICVQIDNSLLPRHACNGCSAIPWLPDHRYTCISSCTTYIPKLDAVREQTSTDHQTKPSIPSMGIYNYKKRTLANYIIRLGNLADMDGWIDVPSGRHLR